MAVGKGSMERASKAVAKPVAKETAVDEIKTKEVASTKTASAKTASAKTASAKTVAAKLPAKKAQAKKTPVKKASADVISSPSKDVLEKIVYQNSQQVLDRDAKPNEAFGIGDSMPIYFL